MNTANRKHHHGPVELSRDRARPVNAPAPSNSEVEGLLTELVSPATYSLSAYYHRLGLRWRILSLPIMVAMVLAMIWRQVPSVATLVRMVAREGLLWAPPLKVSQQAFDQRLSTLPAQLFGEVFRILVPTLLERSRSRSRPQAAPITRALTYFEQLLVVDGTTLEELAHKIGLLRDSPSRVLGGNVLALLDIPSKLPVGIWLDENPKANEKSYLDRLQGAIPKGSLLIFDKGFYSFAFFDWMTDNQVAFLTRAVERMAYKVERELAMEAHLKDRIIRLGLYRSDPCLHPVRLIEIDVGPSWRSYLTNVLDPAILSATDAVELYGHRWRIEEAFLLVKRLLGLAYLQTGSANGIALQVWATFLLYAVLVDLSDEVAQTLCLPLERISLEMVYRGLYHFVTDKRPGQPTDPVAYLASQTDLGIVKRVRKPPPPALTSSQGP